MFCICCLEESGPFIALVKCVHSDYLDTFPIPDLNVPVEKIVCAQCHTILKKIYEFKLQVEESFNILMKQTHSTQTKRYKKSIQVTKVEHLNIPDIQENINVESENDTRSKNIETALEIINNNSTSLQMLAIPNLKDITESLLEVTSGNLNLEGLVSNLNKNPQKEIINSDTVLPIEIKNKSNREEIIKEDLPATVSVIRKIGNTVSLDRASENNFGNVNDKTENKGHYDKYKAIPAALPDVFREIPKSINVKDSDSNSVIKVLPETRDETKEKIVNVDSDLETHYSPSKNEESKPCRKRTRRPSMPPVIPIELSKKELQDERKAKLTSKEYLECVNRCDSCLIGFNYKENLEDHNKRKHEMKEDCVICEICQQVVQTGEINDHRARHYNRLKCEKCDARFVLCDEAYEHYKQVHIPEDVKEDIKKKDLNKCWTGKRKR